MSKNLMDTTLITEVVPEPTPNRSADRQGTITVLVGGDVGAVFAIFAETTTIGRDAEADIALDNDSVSRAHARIWRSNEIYEIEDLGSTNGTLVAGVRVQGRVRLSDGVRVQLGNLLLRFALHDQIDQQASRSIYEMSIRDGLTNLYNRRYFDERLSSEYAFAARHRTPLCVLMVDVDHFKQVNDRYGHHAGDMVLRRIAAALLSGLRTEDLLARYGGEEFVILGRGIDVNGTRLFAERVRALVERMHVVWEGGHIPVTISIGMAHNHSGPTGSTPEMLVAAADSALYAAKRGGRNRAELADSPGRYSAVAEESVDRNPRKRSWHQPTAPVDHTQLGAKAPIAKVPTVEIPKLDPKFARKRRAKPG